MAKLRLKGRKVRSEALQQIKQLLAHQSKQKDFLIENLHLIQDKYQCISLDNLNALAQIMKLSRAKVYEVATFYHHFNIVNDASDSNKLTVRVCESVSCQMNQAQELINSLNQSGLKNIRIQKVPCVGRCDKAPIAVVGTNPIENADINKIKIAVANNKTDAEALSPINFKQYVADNGYKKYIACLNGEVDKDFIIEQLEKSNHRGLGGAGFPVARKWQFVVQQEQARLMAVNIDEGEPGTFKDKFYLEKDPHRFLEGMLIAAWFCQIDTIYIYLRDEYAAIRQSLTEEINQLVENLPVKKLPKIYLRRGAGAYVCGEESAMINSIEGKRGLPRNRPPFTAQVGIFNKPTLVHNMETLYWLRDLLDHGSEFFTSHGRNGHKGLRSFSVSGRVKKPGVYLAPTGISAQELIDEFCGGMLEGHNFYGYFVGGVSGGIMPQSKADIPLDFGTLEQYGSFIGSAAIIVLSQKDRAKDYAINATKFFMEESCGQCTPCRVGTKKLLDLITTNNWDKDLIQDLATTMVDASICGLGQAAPNPVLSIIKYFPNEIEQ